MRKIIPFSKILKFNTDVSEIVAISLDHNINKDSNLVSGIFYIEGEYKILNGGIDSETFKFDLPFDIALGNEYELDTLDVDIDDFRYELIDNNKIKVDIDMYIDGYIVKETVEEEPPKIVKEDNREASLLDELTNNEAIVDKPNIEISNDNENTNISINTNTDNENTNISINTNTDNDKEEYVTYMVYRVTENDTLDNILEQYKITKEELLNYNENLDSITSGDKLIIPAKNEKNNN